MIGAAIAYPLAGFGAGWACAEFFPGSRVAFGMMLLVVPITLVLVAIKLCEITK